MLFISLTNNDVVMLRNNTSLFCLNRCMFHDIYYNMLAGEVQLSNSLNINVLTYTLHIKKGCQ